MLHGEKPCEDEIRAVPDIVSSQDKIDPSHMVSLAMAGSAQSSNDWAFLQDIPSDVSVEAGGVRFSLHKFPLVSKCGWIRKIVAAAKDSDLSEIELPDIPGGAEAFALAVKFCYGVSFEMTNLNIAMLRCAAEYLEMTEDYTKGNLIAQTESFLVSTVFDSIPNCVTVLHQCEALFPSIAEDTRLISRCADSIAVKACREETSALSNVSELSSSGGDSSSQSSSTTDSSKKKKKKKKKPAYLWASELCLLRIDIFQKVVTAMKDRHLSNSSLAAVIVLYAQHSLQLTRKQQMTSSSSGLNLQDQRVAMETLVSLLPFEKKIVPTDFLFKLLRAAILLDTTIACRLEIERRIGMQLEEATLDDLLIPSYSYHGDTLFDIDIAYRVVSNFLLLHQNVNELMNTLALRDHGVASVSPTQSTLMKVARLLDCYLAEIAPDANLSLPKFISLAELLPNHARIVDDGLYRAIDIYLKAHPSLNEVERKRICGVMECRKLSEEACAHAAQNERLPVQTVVQVLYFEQTRLRDVITAAPLPPTYNSDPPLIINGGALSPPHTSSTSSSCDECEVAWRKNQELKLQIASMQLRLSDLEKGNTQQQPQIVVKKRPTSKPKFLQSFTATLGRLNPFQRKDPSSKTPKQSNSSRRRRHSMS